MLNVVMILLICLVPRSALAYVGPGGGLTAIGVFLALVAVIIVALFGFIWYPIKRLLQKRRERNERRNRGAK